jgi:glycosyltransferase involved in cell wall biosynthesis
MTGTAETKNELPVGPACAAGDSSVATSMHPTPRASICIPSYNGAPFIAQAIESALAQTFPDFELLVVDDGSTDGTLEIAEAFAVRDPRVKVHRNTSNFGLPRNWDRCRELASGEWIIFLFQDDLQRPHCLEQMIAAANRHSVSIVCCRRNYIFSAQTPESVRDAYTSYVENHSFRHYFPGAQFVPARQFARQFVQTPNCNFVGEPIAVLLHRDTIRDFGRFHTAMVQLVDFEYFARIAVRNGIAYVDERLVDFRVHAASASARNSQDSQRRDYFDNLVILYDCLHSPAYAGVRRSLKSRLILCRRYLEQEAQFGPHPGQVGKDRWEAAIAVYPPLKYPGLFLRIFSACYRLWHWRADAFRHRRAKSRA